MLSRLIIVDYILSIYRYIVYYGNVYDKYANAVDDDTRRSVYDEKAKYIVYHLRDTRTTYRQ